MNILEEDRVKEATRLLHATDCRVIGDEFKSKDLNPRNQLIRRLKGLLKSCKVDVKDEEYEKLIK